MQRRHCCVELRRNSLKELFGAPALVIPEYGAVTHWFERHLIARHLNSSTVDGKWRFSEVDNHEMRLYCQLSFKSWPGVTKLIRVRAVFFARLNALNRVSQKNCLQDGTMKNFCCLTS